MDSKRDGNATLTCNSTGGPATNVTWTRDSKEVPGGISVLTDAMKARYSHILTLDKRLGGLYQCVVSNNKPSEGNASIILKGMLDHYTSLCTMYQYTSDTVAYSSCEVFKTGCMHGSLYIS